MKKIKLFLMIGVLVMFFSGCTKKNKTIINSISEFADENYSDVSLDIRLSDFTDFDWDNVLVYKYPTSAKEIQDALEIEKYSKSLDLISGMIFVYDGKIVHEEIFEGNYNKISAFIIYPQQEINQKPNYRVFTKNNAIFNCFRTQYDESFYYYRLYPQSN